MTDVETLVNKIISEILERRSIVGVDIRLDSQLHADLDLDSLELAELSAALEDEYDADPFSEGVIPTTVGDIVNFYRASEIA